VRRRWRDRLRMPLVVLLLLNAGVYVAYTLPRSVRERTLSARVRALQQEVDRSRQVTEALRGRADAMQSNRNDVARFYARLGDKSNLTRVREEIASFGRDLGLKVGALAYTPEEVKGGEGVSQFQVRMPVTGTYRQLAAFLDRLERSPYFVTVDQIQIRKRERESGSADLDLVMSAYYRSPGVPASEGAR
jgi:Tfp pilus assembly protein PilO